MTRSTWTCPQPRFSLFPLLVAALVCLAGCDRPNSGGSSSGAPAGGGTPLTILSGSENKSLEPMVQRIGRQIGADVRMQYLGSVDIMLQLESGAPGADAVWPANSLWLDLGDRQKLVKNPASIMRSPVVLGVKKGIAARLGWVGKDVTVEQILQAAEGGKLRFMMTSASQSNSGASAYLGYLYAFAGQPEVLTGAHLRKPEVRAKIRRLLEAVNRSAGSSGWLKDLFLQKYDQYDAMVNYEAVVIEANRDLVTQGKEPLYAVYPVDGLAIADSPLAYVNHGDGNKEQLVTKLQEALRSPETQREIEGLGRRVGLAGLETATADPTLFNPEWGIDLKRVIRPIRFPQAEVVREALDLYQTAFRKPSFTVYCLDYSGSMRGKGIDDLKSAMRLLLDQAEARRYLLQTSDEDVTVVIPFNSAPMETWTATGRKLDELLANVTQLAPEGGTDIYTPVMRALDRFKAERNLKKYFPAVILMSDGKSNTQASMDNLRAYGQSMGLNYDIPVYPILFGEASDEQMKAIAEWSSGRVFDGRKDLVQAFREARGYN